MLRFFFIACFLLPTIVVHSAEKSSFGGSKHVSVSLSNNGSVWDAHVSMTPIKCFSPSINQDVTREHAKRYSFLAIAKSIGIKYFGADTCTVLSESFQKENYSASFRITGVCNIPKKEYNSIIKEQDAHPTCFMEHDILSEKDNYTCEIDSLYAILLLKLRNLDKRISKLDPWEITMATAKLEDSCVDSCKQMQEQIKKNIMLLDFEKNELFNLLSEKKQDFCAALCSKYDRWIASFRKIPDCISNVHVDERFSAYIFADPVLLVYGGVRLYDLPSSRKLLVSVGKTAVCDVPGDIIRQQKVSKVNAIKNLLKARHTRVTNVTVLKGKLVFQYQKDNEKIIENTESFYRTITEQTEGKVRSLPIIGTWFSKDKSIFYTAMGEFITYD